MYSEVWRYDAVSAFLAKRAKRVQSLQEREPEGVAQTVTGMDVGGRLPSDGSRCQ